MNALDAADLIDRCIALGIWPRPVDAEHLEQQATAWAEVLAEVPPEYALATVNAHNSEYGIRPTQIRGKWEDEEKRRRAGLTYDERACAYAKFCNCPHAEGVCYRGYVDQPRETDLVIIPNAKGDRVIEHEVSQWCSRCWDARNFRRSDLGKDPLPLGQIGP